MGLEMKYFVLKPKGDSVYALASRMAMLTYAHIVEEADFDFSREISYWVYSESKDEEDVLHRNIVEGDMNIQQFSFSRALYYLRDGCSHKVRRAGWPKERTLKLETVCMRDGKAKDSEPWVSVYVKGVGLVPYDFPTEDVLAEDWEVV